MDTSHRYTFQMNISDRLYPLRSIFIKHVRITSVNLAEYFPELRIFLPQRKKAIYEDTSSVLLI